jgi:hypothetical protein
MATKKKAALAEEVQKAQETTKNDAQGVNEAIPDQKPTPEEKAPETENTSPETQPEAETVPLTLDELEELILPGDAETEEQQPAKRWSITDDGCADWALKKIKAEKDELDRLTELAQAEIARIQDKLARAQRRYEQNTAYLTSMLAMYFNTVPHKVTKSGQESYQLLNGKLVLKPAGVKAEPDDTALVAWLRQNGMEDMIKVEEKAKWGDLKKKLRFVGTVATIEDTGELVEGIKVIETPPQFSVKF